MTYKRFTNTFEKLCADPDALKQCHEVILKQLESGFIEPVDLNEVPNDSKIHYLSHRAVFKESKTTPLRIVFDCSAKSAKHSPSLNECLSSGPSLVNDLPEILQRFRVGRYAVTSDISKAFLQVGLRTCDRDSTRFLWVENPEDPNSKVVCYRFCVVLFGATCSQFFSMLL